MTGEKVGNKTIFVSDRQTVYTYQSNIHIYTSNRTNHSSRVATLLTSNRLSTVFKLYISGINQPAHFCWTYFMSFIRGDNVLEFISFYGCKVFH